MTRLFITGGTGYIGTAVVNQAIKEGYDTTVLTRSTDKAAELEARGIRTVVGDLLEDGPWQESLKEADVVIHLASPPTWGKRITRKRAISFGEGHLALTKRLLDAIPETVTRVVYIAGTSYFGDTGTTKQSETFKPEPKGWGPFIQESVECLPEYLAKGVPIVTAFPAQIYGPNSWTEQLFLTPLSQDKKVTTLKGYEPMFSPIHVEDCARACLFLGKNGEIGESYVLVDYEPVSSLTFMNRLAEELEKIPQVRYVPKWLCEIALGPVLTEYATAHTCFSNEKLVNLGFSYLYPTAREGIPAVVKEWVR